MIIADTPEVETTAAVTSTTTAAEPVGVIVATANTVPAPAAVLKTTAKEKKPTTRKRKPSTKPTTAHSPSSSEASANPVDQAESGEASAEGVEGTESKAKRSRKKPTFYEPNERLSTGVFEDDGTAAAEEQGDKHVEEGVTDLTQDDDEEAEVKLPLGDVANISHTAPQLIKSLPKRVRSKKSKATTPTSHLTSSSAHPTLSSDTPTASLATVPAVDPESLLSPENRAKLEECRASVRDLVAELVESER